MIRDAVPLIVAIALVILVFPLLRKIGDVLPWSAALVTGVAAIFLAPKVPRSPVACLDTGKACSGTGTDWVIGLVFLLPIAVAIVIKVVRGDKRSGRP